MIRFEPNVRVSVWAQDIAEVLHRANEWSLLRGIGVVVNAWTDGTHRPTSLHPYGLAIDLDTEGDRAQDLGDLHAWLTRHMPAGYDVLLEGDHVHVEWDMHR